MKAVYSASAAGKSSSRWAINRVFLCSVLLLATALMIWAQAESGQITGTIADPSGAVVANAAVKATNTLTGTERSSVTNNAGVYVIPSLPAGTYTLTVT